MESKKLLGAAVALSIGLFASVAGYAAQPGLYAEPSGNVVYVRANSDRSGVYSCSFTINAALENGSNVNLSVKTDVSEGLSNVVVTQRGFNKRVSNASLSSVNCRFKR